MQDVNLRIGRSGGGPIIQKTSMLAQMFFVMLTLVVVPENAGHPGDTREEEKNCVSGEGTTRTISRILDGGSVN